MIAQAHSATLIGIEALPIVVETDLLGPIADGMNNFVLVGLPDKAVMESKERVKTAMKNSGLDFPDRRIVCNLAPGDIRKEGPWLDLPMAAAICAVQSLIDRRVLEETLLLGELGLDGTLRPINGAVSVALMAHERGFKRLIVPKADAAEAAVVTGLEVYGVRNLLEAISLLNGNDEIEPERFDDSPQVRQVDYGIDYSDVKGQRHGVRAMEIAAAGGHNVLMVGPPGSGKTMLSRRLPTILPPLAIGEAIEVTRIHSSSGQKAKPGLIWERPFRSPHHSASHVALVGGGKIPKPGEISMAHHGVLFMDEMPEFERSVLEALRQPLEDAVVTVSRAHSTITFPASTILIGAMNPCPCGFRGLPEQKCISSPGNCIKYAGKISGPLMDRIDLHIEVPRLTPEDLLNSTPGESSAAIRERVIRARELQDRRLGKNRVNAKMTPREIKAAIVLDEECAQFMKVISARMNLSARVFDRILKVARTLADLANEPTVRKPHLAEAVQYRERTET